MSVFLDADFDLATLLPGDTEDQVFRIAILPASFGATGKTDLSDLPAIMDRIGVGEGEIVRTVVD